MRCDPWSDHELVQGSLAKEVGVLGLLSDLIHKNTQGSQLGVKVRFKHLSIIGVTTVGDTTIVGGCWPRQTYGKRYKDASNLHNRGRRAILPNGDLFRYQVPFSYAWWSLDDADLVKFRVPSSNTMQLHPCNQLRHELKKELPQPIWRSIDQSRRRQQRDTDGENMTKGVLLKSWFRWHILDTNEG